MTWATQRKWRWCKKCLGLWFGGGGSSGVCPNGAQHNASNSANYSLVHDVSPLTTTSQSNWRWCGKCQGLWLAGGDSAGLCPAGSGHSLDGSADYVFTPGSGGGQTGWRLCNKCLSMWYSGAGGAGVCKGGGGHSSAGSGDYHIVQVTSTVRVHVKILTTPDVPIETSFQQMRDLYALGKFDVEWASTETLDLPDLNDLDVGTCTMGVATEEQASLFSHRNNVGANEMVVYFIRSTVPPYNGCAASPAGQPGAVIVQGATQWTLAHELGHVLGLRHVTSTDRLMYGGGTANLTNLPPDLIDTELSTMAASVLTISV